MCEERELQSLSLMCLYFTTTPLYQKKKKGTQSNTNRSTGQVLNLRLPSDFVYLFQFTYFPGQFLTLALSGFALRYGRGSGVG